jgi:DNA-binding IclR family transcriptional regulator
MKQNGLVSDGGAYRVQVLERALRILDTLAAEGQLAPSEISARLSLHKSTVHRLLAVLEQNEYVDRSQANGMYSLGLKLIELGTRASSRLDLCELAGPILDRLMEQTGETAHMGILNHGAVISVADSESYKTLRTPSTVGRRTPVHCSSQGKVLLAELNATEVRTFVRRNGLKSFTRHTIRNISGLQRELAQVREQGYAVDDHRRPCSTSAARPYVRVDRVGDGGGCHALDGTGLPGGTGRARVNSGPEFHMLKPPNCAATGVSLGHTPISSSTY